MGKKKIPDRWLNYKAIGKKVAGTPFVAFKVPLRERICDNLPDEKKHTTKDVIKAFPELGMVIDLTATKNRSKYYEPCDWKNKGILYKWIECKGHVMPSQHLLTQFCKTVNKFLINNPKKLIGVHCTHGLNRTGYFICSFMVLVMQIPPNVALKSFALARGYEIERKNYVSSIISHDKNLELKKLLSLPKKEEESAAKIKFQESYGDHDEIHNEDFKVMDQSENEKEQEKLKNCMDISGFSTDLLESTKSLKEIVSEVLNDHKIPHDDENIVDVQKKEISENKFILIVTFNSVEVKTKIMKLKREFHRRQKFTISFNHSLTSTNKFLFYQAKNLSEKLNLRVNVTHGKIFINSLNGKFGVRIKSKEDIDRIEQNGGIEHAGPSTSR